MWLDTWLVTLIAIAALGAASGSFLFVLVERTRSATSSWRGRSTCPHCGRTLRWFELIPVMSWVLLGGRCRTCRVRLTSQYVTMELVTALAFVLLTVTFGWTWLTIASFGTVMVMIALAAYDAKWALLPDEWSYILAGLAVMTALLGGARPVDVLLGGAVGVSFFGVQWLASRGRWVGSGDILLGLGLGLLLGWRMFGLALFIGYMTGALVAAVQILRRKLTLEQSMPFGPYLLGGGFVAWLYGEKIVDWYYNHAIFR